MVKHSLKSSGGPHGKRIIQPRGIAEAVGLFARAILIDRHLYIAGTSALSRVSGGYYDRFAPEGIEEQTRLTLENIKKCVEAANGTIDDIYKLVIMLRNTEDYENMNIIRAEYFTKSQTISTCFHAGVMRADILVEIEDVAYIANPTTSD
ncbi:RidA family protein [Burkholderia sp. R-69980]|nr:RidA family protein [Burkholderia sp. R-69980]